MSTFLSDPSSSTLADLPSKGATVNLITFLVFTYMQYSKEYYVHKDASRSKHSKHVLFVCIPIRVEDGEVDIYERNASSQSVVRTHFGARIWRAQ